MKELSLHIDPRIYEVPEDSARRMLKRIYEAKIEQARQEGYLRGRSEGYEDGFADGRKTEKERFIKCVGEFIREDWN